MDNILKAKISDCSLMIRQIEQIEFAMIDHGLVNERKLSRLIKRGLILKQTEYWNELDQPSEKIIKLYRKKKKK